MAYSDFFSIPSYTWEEAANYFGDPNKDVNKQKATDFESGIYRGGGSYYEEKGPMLRTVINVGDGKKWPAMTDYHKSFTDIFKLLKRLNMIPNDAYYGSFINNMTANAADQLRLKQDEQGLLTYVYNITESHYEKEVLKLLPEAESCDILLPRGAK